MASDINGPERLGSSYIPYLFPPADSSTAQISRDEKSGAAEEMPVVPPTAQEARAIYSYCNTTTEYIDKIRHPEGLPDLEKLRRKEKDEIGGDKDNAGDTGKTDITGEVETKGNDGKTEKVPEPRSSEDSSGSQNVEGKDEDEEKKGKKKRKQLQIDLGATFTPMANKEDIVSTGKTLCQIEGTVTGPDADELDESEKEELKEIAKKIAQNQVASSSGVPLVIQDDGTLTAPSTMKIVSIADGGELSGQKPLSAKGLEDSKPFESSMEDGGGREQEKAQQYLKDNPEAPDAKEVKERLEKLEKKGETKSPDSTTRETESPAPAEDSDGENETEQKAAAQATQGAQGSPKIANTGEAQKSQETKGKKQRDINIETIFTPLVRAGDIVTPGRNIGHFEIQLTGKDADKLDNASKEQIKQDSMQLVEKGSGRSMGIPQDGNLPADSLMKISFIASNGKLESGQRVLSVQGLDGRHPFEAYMKSEGGDELEKAKKYLDDNPEAPDADQVKKKIEKLEKERAFGVRDFGLRPAENEDQTE